MTDFLFVHNHFPGSFGFLAEALLDRGHRCAAIAGEGAPGLAGLPILRWRPARKVTPGLRVAARRTITERYDRRRHCLPTWLALLTFLADTPGRA